MTVKELHEEIVSIGKSQEKLRKLGVKEGKSDNPKYSDPNDMVHTGAITVDDAQILYDYVKENDIKVVLELGTWFGTSAYVMALAGAHVITCDKNNVFVEYEPLVDKVSYFNMLSTEFLKQNKGKFDFVFADASLKAADPKMIKKAFSGPIRFATHDYTDGKKGVRNINKMRDVCGKTRLTAVGEIAFLEEK